MTGFPKLAKPAQRALAAHDINALEDLTKWSESGLRDLHGMGPNALDTLKQAMQDANLQFQSQPAEKT